MAGVSNTGAPAHPGPPTSSAPGPSALPAGRAGAGVGVLAGASAMVCVGGSVAVCSVLTNTPLLTAQAVRYTVACLLLLSFARASGRRLVMPRGSEWLWLLGVAATGLVVFNIALVNGAQHAEPAVLGVAVACVPLIVAVGGSLLERRRPSPVVLAAALVVTCGAVLVQGLGRSDAIGFAWAVVVLCCEAGFTLLAVPVLGRHGPWGVSVHTTWLAAVIFAGLGVVREGPSAAAHLRLVDVLAIGYLAVGVTAVAFVLWYSSVGRLGAGRAGLLTGVAPVAAAAAGIVLGAPAPRPLVWLGIVVVASGLALGLRNSRQPVRQRPERATMVGTAAATPRVGAEGFADGETG
jgi:drug/metabolite transporter (DMT)-like permease